MVDGCEFRDFSNYTYFGIPEFAIEYLKFKGYSFKLIWKNEHLKFNSITTTFYNFTGIQFLRKKEEKKADCGLVVHFVFELNIPFLLFIEVIQVDCCTS